MRLTEKNVVADADVTVGPSATVFFEDFVQTTLILSCFVILGPLFSALNFSELFLNIIGQHQPEVHVGCLFEFSLAFVSLDANLRSLVVCLSAYLAYKSFRAMLRASCPANTMIGVEFYPGLSLFLVDDLEAIVIYKHVRRTSL
jgi:hypothetical protein